MTKNVMREYCKWMPEEDYRRMRELDESVGAILGWRQNTMCNWVPPGAEDWDIAYHRDESMELADQQCTDLGLPFFSYSMNGAMRVLTHIYGQDTVTQKMFFNVLQEHASFSAGTKVSWPECLIALIPELPQHICTALLVTEERRPELDAQRKRISEFTGAYSVKDSGVGEAAISSPWVRRVDGGLDTQPGATNGAEKDSSVFLKPTEILRQKLDNRKWFGICPLDNDQIAIKIDDTEFTLDAYWSNELVQTIKESLWSWQNDRQNDRREGGNGL